MVLYVGIVI